MSGGGMLLAVCHEPWATAAKSWGPTGPTPARLGSLYRYRELAWASPAERIATLRALAAHPRAMLLRGALRAPYEGELSEPRARRSVGSDATLRPTPRRTLGLDFDSVGPASSAAEALARCVAWLPEALQRGVIYGRVTASATHENARMRVWIDLTHPITDRGYRAALAGCPVDLSLARPGQPHFTADPIGASPWTGERDAVLDLPGEPALTDAGQLAGAARECLEQALSRVRRAKESQRHATANAWAYRVGRYVGAGCLDERDARESLTAAGVEAGLSMQRATDEIGRAIRDGSARPHTDEPYRTRLALDDKGAPRPCETNATIIMGEDPAWCDRVAWDVTQQCPVWVDPPEWAQPAAPIREEDAALVALDLAERHRVQMTGGTVYRAISAVAIASPYDPKREWIDAAPYDGIPRIDRFLAEIMGCPDDDYHRDVSRVLFLGPVLRGLQPGAQHDLVPVLCGLEGIGKTQALRDAWGPMLSVITSLEGDDWLYTAMRSLVLLQDEMATMGRVHEERWKAITTLTHVTTRLKYARTATTLPVSWAFIGSRNETHFLRGDHGNRRLLPVTCTRYDRATFAPIASLYIGEARERVRAGEAFWQVARARDEQDERRAADPLAEEIDTLLLARTGSVSVREIMTALGVPVDRWRTSPVAPAVVARLRALGFAQVRAGGARVWARQTATETGPSTADRT